MPGGIGSEGLVDGKGNPAGITTEIQVRVCGPDGRRIGGVGMKNPEGLGLKRNRHGNLKVNGRVRQSGQVFFYPTIDRSEPTGMG